MRTLAVVGAGPGLGMAVARRFGALGFRVGLLARRADALETYVGELEEQGIEAAGFVADVMEPDTLLGALAGVRAELGPIDVLEYGPMPDLGAATTATDTDVESATAQFQFNVVGALTCVHEVLPGMLERGDGGLLFTLGRSAAFPLGRISNVGIAMAGLRNYVHCLHDEVAPKGVYAGTIIVSAGITPGSAADPDLLAALYQRMWEQRDQVEAHVPPLPS